MADTQDMDPQFLQKVFSMIAASGGRITIQSGYRSNEQQAQLYANAVKEHGAADAGNWVAPPGHSNHNKGLAADLGGDIQLAHKLAPQFGLEFPMSWESWHVEPVGLRTQKGTSPQAYVPGPVGSINPTQDPFAKTKPSNMLAMLSDALQGANTKAAAGAGFVDDPGSVATDTSAAVGGQGTGGSSSTQGAPGPIGPVTLQSGAAGGDKRTPGKSIQDWAHDVLTGLGMPTTQENMQTMITWANTESGGYNPNAAGGRYNPLNTTEGAVGYVGQGGSQGDIKDFGSYDQGVQAIVHNLTKTKGAGYENILGALSKGNDPQGVFSAINGSAFGTHFGAH